MIDYLKNKYNIYFREGDALALKARRNVLYSFISKAGSIGISLLLVPMTINYVNPVQYGIWLTLSSIIGWFNFFDIGLGNGLKNKLAESNAVNDLERSRILVSTTYGIIIIVSSIIFVLFLLVNPLINWSQVLNLQGSTNLDLHAVAFLLVCIFCLQFVFQLINTVLTGCHEPAKVSMIALISQVICLIVIYTMSIRGTGSLLMLVFVIGGIPLLITMLSNIWYFSRQYSFLRPSIKLIRFTYGKQLLLVGGAFFIIQIGQLVLYQTDNIIITRLFGPEEVTVFNMAYKLFSVIIIVFTIGITPYWSAFTEAYVKKDFPWMRKTFSMLTKGWFYICLCTLALTIISPLVFKLWLKDLVQVPFKLSVSMAFYVIAASFHMLCCFFLNGVGKIRLQLYLYVLCFFCNVPLALLLGKYFGIAGVTYSNMIVLALMGGMLYIQCNKIIYNRAAGIWNI